MLALPGGHASPRDRRHTVRRGKLADMGDVERGDVEAAEASAGVGVAMARAHPDDTAGEVLARARVAGALFGPDAAAGPGLFRILDRLGAGGMGVVYAAYDPDLDRGVALKLVQVPAGGRDAALVEAKALATRGPTCAASVSACSASTARGRSAARRRRSASSSSTARRSRSRMSTTSWAW
jgi:serine/threonine protein kinase